MSRAWRSCRMNVLQIGTIVKHGSLTGPKQLQCYSDVTSDMGACDGLESCIGNTPLFRIKSLSEQTGCDIFGKAEVCAAAVSDRAR